MSTDRSISRDPTGGPWAAGFAMSAGVLMMTLGAFQAFQGLAALISGDFYLEVGDYAFEVDVTTWGWVHLILGIAIAVTGGFVLVGATWARIIGIVLAVVSAIANFLFIPYYPFWSILIIAFNVFVIWGLSNYNPDAGRI